MVWLRRALGHLISCKHASHLISEMQDRKRVGFERVGLNLHLAWCHACIQFERQVRFLREAMRKYRE